MKLNSTDEHGESLKRIVDRSKEMPLDEESFGEYLDIHICGQPVSQNSKNNAIAIVNAWIEKRKAERLDDYQEQGRLVGKWMKVVDVVFARNGLT